MHFKRTLLEKSSWSDYNERFFFACTFLAEALVVFWEMHLSFFLRIHEDRQAKREGRKRENVETDKKLTPAIRIKDEDVKSQERRKGRIREQVEEKKI